jgi:hypothetical protein
LVLLVWPTLRLRRWKQYFPPKQWYTFARLHGVTCEASIVDLLVTWHSIRVESLSENLALSEQIEVEVNLRPTVSRPVCLGAGIPSGTHDQISFISLTIAGFLIWGTLSDERMGPECTCTIASGPSQSSHSCVEVPQNSRPYFTVSFETPPTWRARFPYLYPPGTG